MFDVKTDTQFHGRDFSHLLGDEGSKQAETWTDIAFARGTGDQAGWLMAVSDRYKLVVASNDQPWLFDLERDPDELINMIDNSAYRAIATDLGVKLEAYCNEFKDPRLESPRIAADIDWLARGKGPYPGPTSVPGNRR